MSAPEKAGTEGTTTTTVPESEKEKPKKPAGSG